MFISIFINCKQETLHDNQWDATDGYISNKLTNLTKSQLD